MDYLTGPDFLDAAVQQRRVSAARAWSPAPHADPLPAIEDWARAMSQREISLMLLPTPVKPSIRPQGLAGPAAEDIGAVQNPAFAGFLERVRAARKEIHRYRS